MVQRVRSVRALNATLRCVTSFQVQVQPQPFFVDHVLHVHAPMGDNLRYRLVTPLLHDELPVGRLVTSVVFFPPPPPPLVGFAALLRALFFGLHGFLLFVLFFLSRPGTRPCWSAAQFFFQ